MGIDTFISIDRLMTLLVVFAVSIVIVLSRTIHQHITSDLPDKVQGLHVTPVPRVGGSGIFIGLVVGMLILNQPFGSTGWLLLVSALPVFIFGTLEDIYMEVTPLKRLVAAVASGGMAIFLLQVWISGIRVPVFDTLMAWAPAGIFFTIFASATMCHAYNLSDGLNGLCSGFAIIALTGIGVMALKVGDAEVANLSFVFVFAILGFWGVNFSSGKIFLGDGGAYLLGHLVAWLSIILSARHPEVSPWALFLNTLIPLLDTISAIARRMGHKLPVDMPDRQHFHHLVYDAIGKRFPTLLPPVFRNSLAALTFLVLAALSSSIAIIYSGFTTTAMGICLVFGAILFFTSRKLYKYIYKVS